MMDLIEARRDLRFALALAKAPAPRAKVIVYKSYAW